MTSSATSSAATTSSSASDSRSSSSASIFNQDNFLRKLENLTPTQESIQTVALWIIHHKNNHEILCNIWFKRLKECMKFCQYYSKNFNFTRIFISLKKKLQ
jgi:hypothetical protein